MNIIKLAFGMSAAVEKFLTKAKRFYYLVMLSGYHCPKCKGSLSMVTEGRCRCDKCSNEFDPTVVFQRCLKCNGTAILRIRRYQCEDCGEEITSRFLFDGLIFNAEYFKAKMSESRQHKKEQKERVKKMLAESRSDVLLLQAADLDGMSGLADALSGLIAGVSEDFVIESVNEFDLNRYETHIKAHIRGVPISFDDIPPLDEDGRKDRIWRFVALIFLAHSRIVSIWQNGRGIMVKKIEADRKGQGVFGESEEVDGDEGSVGRIEA